MNVEISFNFKAPSKATGNYILFLIQTIRASLNVKAISFAFGFQKLL
jgi:hypothetical protein